jgi:hypothetical protein
MNDAELRRSLANVGPLLPALHWQGEVLDGKRRAAICDELGVYLPIRYAESLQVACSALWPLHPKRALELAGTRSVSDLAELCSVGVGAIAVELARHRPKAKPERRAPRHTRDEKKVLVQVWVDPQWKHYMQRAGEAAKLPDLSAAIRRAGWDLVQRVLPNPPQEGTRRGPAIELVRPDARGR